MSKLMHNVRAGALSSGGVFPRLRLGTFARRISFVTDFRPYISSVGQNWISFFSNISAKVQARPVKLAKLIDSWTLYRHMSTDARYYFRFRHRAPRKSFSFFAFNSKKRLLAIPSSTWL